MTKLEFKELFQDDVIPIYTKQNKFHLVQVVDAETLFEKIRSHTSHTKIFLMQTRSDAIKIINNCILSFQLTFPEQRQELGIQFYKS